MTPRDIALAAFVSVVWGLAFVATRFGLEGFTAPQLTALRFLIASIPVLFVARPAVPWHLLVLIGLSLFAVQFLLLFLAFRHGMPPGLASVTQQTHVFLTVLLAALLFGERPTARHGLSMILATAGLVLVGLTVGADLPALALALALSGALSWAVGNLLLKHVRGVPMFPLIAWCRPCPCCCCPPCGEKHPCRRPSPVRRGSAWAVPSSWVPPPRLMRSGVGCWAATRLLSWHPWRCCRP